MTLFKNCVVALTTLGGVAVAAVLAVRRNERRLEAVQRRTALEVWDNETGGTGSTMKPASLKPPS